MKAAASPNSRSKATGKPAGVGSTHARLAPLQSSRRLVWCGEDQDNRPGGAAGTVSSTIRTPSRTAASSRVALGWRCCQQYDGRPASSKQRPGRRLADRDAPAPRSPPESTSCPPPPRPGRIESAGGAQLASATRPRCRRRTSIVGLGRPALPMRVCEGLARERRAYGRAPTSSRYDHPPVRRLVAEPLTTMVRSSGSARWPRAARRSSARRLSSAKASSPVVGRRGTASVPSSRPPRE